MKLTTIWDPTINFPLQERFYRTWHDWTLPKIAAHVPARLRCWVLITEGVRNIGGSETVPDVPFTVVLNRAGKNLRGRS